VSDRQGEDAYKECIGSNLSILRGHEAIPPFVYTWFQSRNRAPLQSWLTQQQSIVNIIPLKYELRQQSSLQPVRESDASSFKASLA